VVVDRTRGNRAIRVTEMLGKFFLLDVFLFLAHFIINFYDVGLMLISGLVQPLEAFG
jgi:hypothetical protein